ncbi:hypothetical protein D3C80_1960410 [compost metagenome]
MPQNSGSVMPWNRLPGRLSTLPSGNGRSYSATSSLSLPGLPASRIRSYLAVAGMPATMPSIVSYWFEVSSHRVRMVSICRASCFLSAFQAA